MLDSAGSARLNLAKSGAAGASAGARQDPDALDPVQGSGRSCKLSTIHLAGSHTLVGQSRILQTAGPVPSINANSKILYKVKGLSVMYVFSSLGEGQMIMLFESQRFEHETQQP